MRRTQENASGDRSDPWLLWQSRPRPCIPYRTDQLDVREGSGASPPADAPACPHLRSWLRIVSFMAVDAVDAEPLWPTDARDEHPPATRSRDYERCVGVQQQCGTAGGLRSRLWGAASYTARRHDAAR